MPNILAFRFRESGACFLTRENAGRKATNIFKRLPAITCGRMFAPSRRRRLLPKLVAAVLLVLVRPWRIQALDYICATLSGWASIAWLTRTKRNLLSRYQNVRSRGICDAREPVRFGRSEARSNAKLPRSEIPVRPHRVIRHRSRHSLSAPIWIIAIVSSSLFDDHGSR